MCIYICVFAAVGSTPHGRFLIVGSELFVSVSLSVRICIIIWVDEWMDGWMVVVAEYTNKMFLEVMDGSLNHILLSAFFSVAIVNTVSRYLNTVCTGN